MRASPLPASRRIEGPWAKTMGCFDLRADRSSWPVHWVGIQIFSRYASRRDGLSKSPIRIIFWPARSSTEAWEMLRDIREAGGRRGICVRGDLADLGRYFAKAVELRDGKPELGDG